MHVTIIGTGYVGLTTAVALAYVGHEITAVDKVAEKIILLREGKSPIHEAGVEELLAHVSRRLHFTEDLTQGVPQAEVIFIAVGTPTREDGTSDLRYVEDAAREVAAALHPGQTCTLVLKSTVPIGTNRRIMRLVEDMLAERHVAARVTMASNPEFLREGVALHDTLYCDRIVVGSEQPEAVATLGRLYRPILEQTFVPPSFLPRPERQALPYFITTDFASAEMMKYAANAFLPLKISFINEIAGLCEKVGADVTEVARGIGCDSRIGQRFLGAGLGWGGSCFPKDTAALLSVAAEYGYTMPILQAAREVNQRQRMLLVDKLATALSGLSGRTVAILGLAFKPNTDDVRDSPALELVRLLVARGVCVRVHDPVAMPNARLALQGMKVTFADNPYMAASEADALVLATEWDDYRSLDFIRLAAVMRRPLLVDGRNLYTPADLQLAGFQYLGVGR